MNKNELLTQFTLICSGLTELAEKIDENKWANSCFHPALAILENDDLSVQHRLESAYDCTNVFGGMGSWIDSPPYSAYLYQQTEQYDYLTNELWKSRQAVMRLSHLN